MSQDDVSMKKISIAENPLDILLKSISTLKFKDCFNLIGLCNT